MAYLAGTFATFKAGIREKTWFILLVYLDVILTLYALNAGFSELNPFAQRIFGNPEELLLVKGISPIFIAWLVPGKLLIPAIFVLLFVTIWNVKELLIVLA